MLKVHIIKTCLYCNGEAYLSIGDAVDKNGRMHTCSTPCPMYEGMLKQNLSQVGVFQWTWRDSNPRPLQCDG